MGHKNKKSLTRQVQECFESKLRIGHSKHKDKLDASRALGHNRICVVGEHYIR